MPIGSCFREAQVGQTSRTVASVIRMLDRTISAVDTRIPGDRVIRIAPPTRRVANAEVMPSAAMKTLHLMFSALLLLGIASQTPAASAPDSVLTLNNSADSGNLVSLIS